MSTQEARERLELLQGTLDLLILRTLVFGPQHGQGIARCIQKTSEEALLVEHGALYPALQRREAQGWVAARWGTSANNRKARFYTLTQAGRKQLAKESTRWRRLVTAIGRILGAEAKEGELCSDASGQRATSMLKLRPICSLRSSGCRKRAGMRRRRGLPRAAPSAT